MPTFDELALEKGYCCPVSQEIMVVPVTVVGNYPRAADGKISEIEKNNSFEYEYLRNWLSQNPTNPKTRDRLTMNNCGINIALQNEIEAFVLSVEAQFPEEAADYKDKLVSARNIQAELLANQPQPIRPAPHVPRMPVLPQPRPGVHPGADIAPAAGIPNPDNHSYIRIVEGFEGRFGGIFPRSRVNRAVMTYNATYSLASKILPPNQAAQVSSLVSFAENLTAGEPSAIETQIANSIRENPNNTALNLLATGIVVAKGLYFACSAVSKIGKYFSSPRPNHRAAATRAIRPVPPVPPNQ